MRWFVVAALASLSGTAWAAGGGPPVPPPYVPRWDVTPSHEDMAKAWNSLKPGTAPVLLSYSCYIRNNGTLYSCASVSPAKVEPDVDSAAQGLLKIFHVNIKYALSLIHI